jgi:uncharacterized membrane protein YgdD (TMEM256/DUF423 family)
MPEFLISIADFIQATRVPEQFQEVDVKGLFTNFYFLVPFLALIGHVAYRKSIATLILIFLFIGVWIFSGTPYMQDLVVDGELQLEKVLPLAGAGVVVTSVIVYLLFIRSD